MNLINYLDYLPREILGSSSLRTLNENCVPERYVIAQAVIIDFMQETLEGILPCIML